jgi:ABC-type amino acid transport substrate-binding protein
MLIRASALLLILFTGVSGANQIAEQPLEITLRYGIDPVGAWVPFDRTDNPDYPGVFIEIIPLLMSEANLNTKAFLLPTKRGLQQLYSGELDFDFINPEWMSNEDKTAFVYSIPLFEVTEFFISLATNPKSFDTSELAHNQLVGTVSGYYYFDDNKFTRADFRSESEVILGLNKKRFDVAIMEKAAAAYWAEKHSVDLKFGAVHTQGNIVLRLRAELAHLMPRINQAILRLKDQGEIPRILAHYLSDS